jgi:membrane-associated phospholipid phosphatase
MLTEIRNLRLTLLVLIVVGWVATLSLAACVGIRIDYPDLLTAFGVATVSGLGLIAYANYRQIRWLIGTSEVFVGGVLLAVPVVLSTYVAMRFDFPLADEWLEAIDRRLFDWWGFISFVDGQPRLASILGFSYESFLFQIVALPLALCLYGSTARAYRTVILFGLICFVSSLISIWFPAIGTFPRYLNETDRLDSIDTHFGFFFLSEFNAVRNDPKFVFSTDKLAGILTFPSVHAAVAVLCAWAAWGIRYARLPFLLLNILMVTSAVSHGSHYLIDVLAGIVLAPVCIAVVCVLSRSRPSRLDAAAPALASSPSPQTA